MRAILLGLLLGMAGVVLASSQAAAQIRTITLDFDTLHTPVHLPPPESQPLPEVPSTLPDAPTYIVHAPAPPPIIQPAPTPAAPYLVPSNESQPSGYNPLDCCADGSYLWLSADFLLGWVRSQPLPALATTGSAVSPTTPGALGQPGTSVLVGNEGANGNIRAGMRLSGGVWFDHCHTFGLQGSYFFFAAQSSTRTVGSDGSTVLARPYFDVSTGLPSALPVGLPGVVSGTVTVRSTSDGLRGASAVLRENIYGVGDCTQASWVRLDMIGGYSFFALQEGLTVSNNLAFTNGTRATLADLFRTRNEFHGGQVGLIAQSRRGCWSWEADLLVSLGVTAQTASIQAGGNGGLLAQVSNTGLYRREQFSVVPQAGLKVGYHLNQYVRLTLGYQFLYWSSIARPGDQVDLSLDGSRLGAANFGPWPSRPRFSFRETDVWGQALTAGVEFSY